MFPKEIDLSSFIYPHITIESKLYKRQWYRVVGYLKIVQLTKWIIVLLS